MFKITRRHVNRSRSTFVTLLNARAHARGPTTVFKVIDVAVVWDDPRLFECIWAYAARVPDLEVRETSVATLLGTLLGTTVARPDVVLVEVARRDTDPVADIRRLCRAGYRVLALSTSTDPYLSASLLGTGACLLLGRNQPITAIAAAIRAAGPGRGRRARFPVNGNSAASNVTPLRPRLSQRERSVLMAYTSGMTLAAVAQRVGIRPSTAKTYLERVKAKYREIGRPAYTKLELAQRAHEDGSYAHVR